MILNQILIRLHLPAVAAPCQLGSIHTAATQIPCAQSTSLVRILRNGPRLEVCLLLQQRINFQSLMGAVGFLGCKVGACRGLKVHHGSNRNTLQSRSFWTCEWPGLACGKNHSTANRRGSIHCF